MGFASAYLEKRELFPSYIKEAPDDKTGIIVVIPAYNETGICLLLDSLILCTEPGCKVEVIVVVNAPGDASAESIENNKRTVNNIESWRIKHNNCFFRLFIFEVPHPPLSGWGVGPARKTGMDEAVRRFNKIINPDGVILNLDADCLVEKNYFQSVYNELYIKKDRKACSIYFEHPLSGNQFPDIIYRSISLYELHLRYYFQALAFSGFPYVFHTVGSALAVKALSYVKVGGMNKRRAGEDFYFIQKLVSSGGYFSLNSTTVYPSPRASERVPFGTGASIGKLIDRNASTFQTYNFLAFKELRSFFEITRIVYHSNTHELPERYRLLPSSLKVFINEMEWIEKMSEIKNNTSGLLSFNKRFFDWFNMFRIVKYLNFTHLGIFAKKPVNISASELIIEKGYDLNSNHPVDLLKYFRALEKDG